MKIVGKAAVALAAVAWMLLAITTTTTGWDLFLAGTGYLSGCLVWSWWD